MKHSSVFHVIKSLNSQKWGQGSPQPDISLPRNDKILSVEKLGNNGWDLKENIMKNHGIFPEIQVATLTVKVLWISVFY